MYRFRTWRKGNIAYSRRIGQHALGQFPGQERTPSEKINKHRGFRPWYECCTLLLWKVTVIIGACHTNTRMVQNALNRIGVAIAMLSDVGSSRSAQIMQTPWR